MRFSARQSIKILKSRNAGKLIGYLLLVMGLVGFAHFAKVKTDEIAARDWVPHTAQIKSAVLETHVNDKGGKTYTIKVAYSFDWNGDIFNGAQYRLHDKAGPNLQENEKIVHDLLRAKQDGDSHPIFVNPDNPDQSAILNMAHPKTKSSSLFLGLLFSVMGYFTAFDFGLWGKRKRNL